MSFTIKKIQTFYYTKYYLFLVLCLLLAACAGKNTAIQRPMYRWMLEGVYKETVPLISVQKLEKQLQKKEINKPVLLDTRAKDEYNISHLQAAKWVGFDTFDSTKVQYLFPNKDTTIVVYCSIGARSEQVGEELQKMGFTNVYNLHGGIFEWKNRG